MRSKQHIVNSQRASAANKPFVTEYRLAFRDPTAQKRKKVASKTAASNKNQTASSGPAPFPPAKEVQAIIAAHVPSVEEVRLSYFKERSNATFLFKARFSFTPKNCQILEAQ
jgi:hypothetical protein